MKIRRMISTIMRIVVTMAKMTAGMRTETRTKAETGAETKTMMKGRMRTLINIISIDMTVSTRLNCLRPYE